MSRIWSSAAASSMVPEATFKRIALTLACGQVLYHSNTQQRGAYQLVREHRNAFADVLEHLGLRLGVDDEYRFVYVVPEDETDRELSAAETLLALVLRRIHHERSIQGNSQDGVVTITLSDLYARYQAITGKELPGPGAAAARETLLGAMHRYGILRKVATAPDSDLPYDIQILPAITALISEDTMARIAADAIEADAESADTSEDAA